MDVIAVLGLVIAVLGLVVAILLWLFPPEPLRRLFRIERKEKEKLTPSLRAIEVPKNILFQIEMNTSLELVRELLSSPHKIYKSTHPVFSKDNVATKVWSYYFSNAYIEIESDDGETVSVITIQVHHPSADKMFDIPYSKPMGELTLQDVVGECGLKKVKLFSSMRDAYIAIECYKGRLGGYLTYTFGHCSSLKLMRAKLVSGKVLSESREELDLSKILVDFVSISHQEDRGHPISRG